MKYKVTKTIQWGLVFALIFFFIYYWKFNPDLKGNNYHCVVGKDSHEASFVIVTNSTFFVSKNPGKDVTYRFVRWFAFGSIIQVLYILQKSVNSCGNLLDSKALNSISMILEWCFIMLGGLIWIVLGTVIRFDQAGKICAGDFASKEDRE